MDFVVHLEGRTFSVRVQGDECLVDGKAIPLDLAPASEGAPMRSVRVDGRSLRVLPQRINGAEGTTWVLDIEGVQTRIEVLDRGQEAIRAARQRTGAVAGPRPLKAPMPGMVVRVDVAPGDEVRAGQGLVIVEAMKMENELKAEASGRVRVVHAIVGAPVEKDAVLVEFEVPEPTVPAVDPKEA